VLEQEMEDLIAAYPNEFFPRNRLTLQGRQGSFREVGRFDLLFADEFGTHILMELKAVPARYENATQLARYKDALRERGTANVLMWLVAPSIPRSVRDFLDHVGIEYTEIHESEFRKVAVRHGYSFANHNLPVATVPASVKDASRTKNQKSHFASVDWFFNTDESESPGAYLRMIDQSCIALWKFQNQEKDPEETLSRPEAGQRVFYYLNGVGIIATGLFTAEPPIASNSIFGKKTELEFRRSVRDLLKVDTRHALTVKEVGQMGYALPYRNTLCEISNKDIPAKMLKALESRSLGFSEKL
jgi:hypothetical protein